MTLGFDVNAGDLLQGTLLQMRLFRRFLIFVAVLAIILFGVDFYYYYVKGCQRCALADHLIATTKTVAGLSVAWIAAIRFIVLPLNSRRRLKQNPFFYTGIVMDLDDEGIRVKSANSTTTWKWTDLRGYRENASVYLICPSKTVGYILPKRVLPEADARDVEALLKGKLQRLG